MCHLFSYPTSFKASLKFANVRIAQYSSHIFLLRCHAWRPRQKSVCFNFKDFFKHVFPVPISLVNTEQVSSSGLTSNVVLVVHLVLSETKLGQLLICHALFSSEICNSLYSFCFHTLTKASISNTMRSAVHSLKYLRVGRVTLHSVRRSSIGPQLFERCPALSTDKRKLESCFSQRTNNLYLFS